MQELYQPSQVELGVTSLESGRSAALVRFGIYSAWRLCPRLREHAFFIHRGASVRSLCLVEWNAIRANAARLEEKHKREQFTTEDTEEHRVQWRCFLCVPLCSLWCDASVFLS